MAGKNTWICKTQKTIFTTPVMELLERDCVSSEDDRPYRFYVLSSRDWCNIVPITADGNVVLVRQFRIGIEQHTLEIPGGIVDAQDESLQEAAVRELAEETGYSALPGARCVSLGWIHPNPAILNNKTHFFAVGPVARSSEQNLDLGEMIDVVEVPIAELPARIASGEITHALTLNALFALMLRFGQGARAMSDALAGFTQTKG